MVIANFAALLNDDDVWDSPDRFWPDRFIGVDGKLIVPDEYLPFGYGNRLYQCLQSVVGKVERLVEVHFLRR